MCWTDGRAGAQARLTRDGLAHSYHPGIHAGGRPHGRRGDNETRGPTHMIDDATGWVERKATAVLVLADGTVLYVEGFGATGEAVG